MTTTPDSPGLKWLREQEAICISKAEGNNRHDVLNAAEQFRLAADELEKALTDIAVVRDARNKHLAELVTTKVELERVTKERDALRLETKRLTDKWIDAVENTPESMK